jgi:hypothetical protein
MITISVQNQSTVTTDAAVQAMLPGLTAQLNNDVQPIWGTDTVTMVWTPKGTSLPAENWLLTFVNDSDQAGALAYHDVTPAGEPLALVFCRTLMNDKASISVAASHELCEMIVDPELNRGAQSPTGQFWALEICDPCEDDSYGYQSAGTLVSDFITPNWFSPQTLDGVLYSFKGNVKHTFQVLPRGYAQWFNPRKGWVQVTGRKAKGAKVNAQRGSRRERRARLFGQQ